jgi:hypothetical protein
MRGKKVILHKEEKMNANEPKQNIPADITGDRQVTFFFYFLTFKNYF